MDEEVWKEVPGWEGHYEVSSMGRLRSLTRTRYARNRTRVFAGRLVYGCSDKGGYRIVTLRDCASNRARTYRLHTLVLLAFVGPRPHGMQACHWNDDKDDNRISNLRWDTVLANANDKKRNGGYLCGEHNPQSKLSQEQAAAIRSNTTDSHAKVAAIYGVSPSLVWAIRKGRAWKAMQ